MKPIPAAYRCFASRRRPSGGCACTSRRRDYTGARRSVARDTPSTADCVLQPISNVWCYSIKGMFPESGAPNAARVRAIGSAHLMTSPLWSDEHLRYCATHTTSRSPLAGLEGGERPLQSRRRGLRRPDARIVVIHQREGNKERTAKKTKSSSVQPRRVLLGPSAARAASSHFRNPGRWNWGNVQVGRWMLPDLGTSSISTIAVRAAQDDCRRSNRSGRRRHRRRFPAARRIASMDAGDRRAR